jgi:DNA repair protein RecO (recombination protein O)
MMEALVLRGYPLGESDRIVVVYALERGKVRGVVKGLRRAGQRWGAAFEPLSQVRLTLFLRAGAELGRVTGCELLRSHVALQADPVLAAVCAYLAELVLELTPDQDPQPALYRLLLHVLEALEHGVAPLVAARYAELWILRLSGHLPDLRRCPLCLQRSPSRLRGSELLCNACGGPKLSTDLDFRPATFELGRRILALPLEQVGAAAPAALAQLERLAALLIQAVIEKPLKTPVVLARISRDVS